MPKGMPIFGKKVAERRRAVYLSQATLAKRSGMSVENVKRIEKGETASITPEKFPRLAEALGMELAVAERELKVPTVNRAALVLPDPPASQGRSRGRRGNAG